MLAATTVLSKAVNIPLGVRNHENYVTAPKSFKHLVASGSSYLRGGLEVLHPECRVTVVCVYAAENYVIKKRS